MSLIRVISRKYGDHLTVNPGVLLSKGRQIHHGRAIDRGDKRGRKAWLC